MADNCVCVAVVTGVSSGLGRALAQYFMARGVKVAGVSRRRPDFSPDLWIEADITLESGRERVLSETLALFGRIDILLNNAGKGIYATWEEMGEADLRGVMELDFFAPVLLTRLILPELRKTRGSVVNISSAASRIWVPCMGGYCSAKAALAMFSSSLGIELMPDGVNVLDVAPGQINTGFSSRSFGKRRPPSSPGSGGTSPEALAKCVYDSWRRRCKRVTYPRFLGVGIFIVRAFFRGVLAEENIFTLKTLTERLSRLIFRFCLRVRPFLIFLRKNLKKIEKNSAMIL